MYLYIAEIRFPETGNRILCLFGINFLFDNLSFSIWDN